MNFMKTIRSLVLIATLAVACPVFGQVTPYWVAPPYVLPNSLPIGDEQVIRNWIVSTNGSANAGFNLPGKEFIVTVYYYDHTNGYHYVSIQYTGDGFDSYEDYAKGMAAGGMMICEYLHTNTTVYPPGNSSLWYMPNVTCNFQAPSFSYFDGILLLNTNVGPLSSITSNSFLNSIPLSLQPSGNEFVVMTTPGLSYFKVEVGTPVPCWYSWSNGIVANSDSWNLCRPTYGREDTTNGYLVLSRWYSLAAYPARITVTINGSTAVYTEYGDMISPPTVWMTRDRKLHIVSARGSNVTIWESTDEQTWTAHPSFTSPTGLVSLDIDTSAPKKFFRASIQ